MSLSPTTPFWNKYETAEAGTEKKTVISKALKQLITSQLNTRRSTKRG